MTMIEKNWKNKDGEKISVRATKDGENVAIYVTYEGRGKMFAHRENNPEIIDFSQAAVENYAIRKTLDAVRDWVVDSEEDLYFYARTFGLPVTLLRVDPNRTTEPWWATGGRELWAGMNREKNGFVGEIVATIIDAVVFFELAKWIPENVPRILPVGYAVEK